jgi:hypothetical protein
MISRENGDSMIPKMVNVGDGEMIYFEGVVLVFSFSDRSVRKWMGGFVSCDEWKECGWVGVYELKILDCV